jgi:hypothetical protein
MTVVGAIKRKCSRCSRLFVLAEEAFDRHVATCAGPANELNFQPEELRALIAEFRAVVKRDVDDKLADGLEHELLDRSPPRLSRDTMKRLARWCKTGGIYSDGMEVAWKISRLLFGRVIDRDDYHT